MLVGMRQTTFAPDNIPRVAFKNLLAALFAPLAQFA
jgi:hypothetical protein